MCHFTDNGYLVAWSILEVNKQKTQSILHMVPDSVIIYFELNGSMFAMRQPWCLVFKELLIS